MTLRARSRRTGSSPLTRGKPAYGLTRNNHGRLIPTHAGKTRALWARAHAPGAHPHSRGENGEAGAVIRADLGSSPLTRGKLVEVTESHCLQGLIPTHAGKT